MHFPRNFSHFSRPSAISASLFTVFTANAKRFKLSSRTLHTKNNNNNNNNRKIATKTTSTTTM